MRSCALSWFYRCNITSEQLWEHEKQHLWVDFRTWHPLWKFSMLQWWLKPLDIVWMSIFLLWYLQIYFIVSVSLQFNCSRENWVRPDCKAATLSETLFWKCSHERNASLKTIINILWTTSWGFEVSFKSKSK